MRIVITGASGAIGFRLSARLQAAGHEVIALSRRKCLLPGARQVIVADYEAATIKHALKDISFEGIIHLAALATRPAKLDSLEVSAVNGLLPAQMVSVATHLGAQAVVLAGTNAEYRDKGTSVCLTENDPLEFKQLYGATKAAGGILALNQGVLNGIATGVCRLFNVYGPGDHPLKLLPDLYQKLSQGEAVRLSSGKQVRDFIYIDDACDGMIATLTALIKDQSKTGYFNICTGKSTSISDFAFSVADHMGVDRKLLRFGELPDRPNEIKYSVGNPDHTKATCGWTAAYSLDKGIPLAVKELAFESKIVD